MATLALELTPLLGKILNISYVVLGLGLVIFFHELGHFAVAKWCGVAVERFSIGFGPVLWSRKRGETEYALSAVPFGGYVKMLGQDDLDPSQLSSEEIAEDPRSYSAKPVWQRMAIISAGVVMNIVTGMLFFAFAFLQGIQVRPSVLGAVLTGMPAWEAGLQAGDRITRINDRPADSFDDIPRGVALTTGPVDIEGVRLDGTTFEVTVVPDGSRQRRMIGAGSANSLSVPALDPDNPEIRLIALQGTPAADARPGFEPGDDIVRIDDQTVDAVPQLQDYLARHRSESVVYHVRRAGASDLVPVEVAPNRFRSLGLWMDVGQIRHIQDGSVVARTGLLKVGDKITKVDGMAVGTDINPLRLPEYFADRHGERVRIEATRPNDKGSSDKIEIEITPDDRPGWTEPLSSLSDAGWKSPGLPLDVPALGIAFHLIPTVLKVEEGSPAAAAGVPRLARLKKLELLLPEGKQPELRDLPRNLTFSFEESADGSDSQNWVSAFWTMQQTALRTVRLTLAADGAEKKFELTPQPQADWFVPSRGLWFQPLGEDHRAESFVAAIGMGFSHTRNSMEEVYSTLRSLFGRNLSPKELHGPIGIATAAYSFASQGVPELFLFLGFLSVNLAVLNFLPIPVLDGGHMVFLIWEGVTRKKPAEKVIIAATYCGMIFVLCLMGFVIYLDLFVHT